MIAHLNTVTVCTMDYLHKKVKEVNQVYLPA
jgi:hypothetical protein